MYKILKAEKLGGKNLSDGCGSPQGIVPTANRVSLLSSKLDEHGERIPLTICDYDREQEIGHHRIPDSRRCRQKRWHGLKEGDAFHGFCRTSGMSVRIYP